MMTVDMKSQITSKSIVHLILRERLSLKGVDRDPRHEHSIPDVLCQMLTSKMMTTVLDSREQTDSFNREIYREIHLNEQIVYNEVQD